MEGREQGHRATSIFLSWRDVTLHFAVARESDASDSFGEAHAPRHRCAFFENPADGRQCPIARS